ncbi:hypothetical protein ACFPLB_16490 [Aquamicrobium segne]|uniref:Uncharacterized protein n=1 Tax=Aquamicrobium segne TaxID=469547 RepID=A0ABW0H6D7_9HYPH
MRLDALFDSADFCRRCNARLPMDAYWGRRKYCSVQCRDKDKVGRIPPAERVGRKCGFCDGPISTDKRFGTKFCCHDCHEAHFNRLRSLKRKAARAHLRCHVCGATVEHRGRLYVKYCSQRCNRLAFEARKAAG